jgi:hypothetical protein
VHTQRWKYCVDAPDKDGNYEPGSAHYVEQDLYDLHSDPHELTNLIGLESHQEVFEVLRQRLIRRMVEVGEDAHTIESAPSRPAGQRKVTAAEARS